MNNKFPPWAGALLLLCATAAGAQEKWRIHEWGTFTSLQDERGQAIGGINTDDEPVPDFVYRLANFLLLRPTQLPNNFFQGAPSCHPDVTMRLETPVIYFHPPKSDEIFEGINVHVKFRGGWLSEFYPFANPDTPGLWHDGQPRQFRSRLFQFGPLRSDTVSSLEWNALKIGGDWPLTNTTEHVWLAPRAVKAALVQTTNRESEKFLFYRGVAHLNAPLKISRESGNLVFRSQLEGAPSGAPLAVRSSWLVNIRADGKAAVRALPAIQLDSDASKVLIQTSAHFAERDFSAANLKQLQAALLTALVEDGLFRDEAQALLNTWELSYFKSAGLRVFFIVPRAWTDFYLPLEISLPAEVQRVMVGRIELVTPEQRGLLREISRFPAARIQAELGAMGTNFYGRITSPAAQRNPEEKNAVMRGTRQLDGFVSIPPTYATYLQLGRFRNALILDQARRFPTERLTNFIAAYQLQAYIPAEENPAPNH